MSASARGAAQRLERRLYTGEVSSPSRSVSGEPGPDGGVWNDPMPGLIGSFVQRAVVAMTTYLEQGLRAAGYDITPARAGNVMRNITPEGATIVAIARAAGVSKQAISRQAEGLQKLGYVVIGTSEADRRVRIVKPTPFGLESRDVVAHLYQQLEEKLTDRVGTADLAAFRHVVDALQDIGAETDRGAGPPDGGGVSRP
ncbi:MarR family winged helix-turn-helix transcriptional regulator [Amycolatopsis jiangsuensis]|uniref:DNA-binding MarR family transcriptional regulator n=1 Tax=Amycolatopsis jiangsuensis TaxID=1181879 RepID=A0A840J3L0_9PSEU|nr:MarR family transcriptional regulator [Amycolatopsis jiangsuensis]MBB4689666.1 DNA-binding MarR family transcriptional regulator [Amycolatopsis jiangsuensis]